jgi:hypothetical protein
MNLALWEAYCERLKGAGRVTEASWLDDDPLNVAEIHKRQEIVMARVRGGQIRRRW